MAPYPGARIGRHMGYVRRLRDLVAAVDEHVDVDADSAAGGPAEASVKLDGLPTGGAVELWTIPGGAHVPTISESFAKAALDFFEAHPKP